MSYKILIVDDEDTIIKTVRAYLDLEGYEVQTAMDGHSALQIARQFSPDLVVLDIMLPGLDGLEVLRQLRQSSSVYVVMLTAKADETDKIIGLSMGADDYLTKPFSPRELVARIKAVLRRSREEEPGQGVLIFVQTRLDSAARLAWKGDTLLDLTPIEFDLLATLMRHQGRALSREQLIEYVWGHDYYGDDRVVDVHIGRLRKKVEADPTHPELIVTARGVGYRFADKAA